jgi:hypothetical protein
MHPRAIIAAYEGLLVAAGLLLILVISCAAVPALGI